MDFRKEYPPRPLDFLRSRARNATLLLDLDNCDAGYSPTEYQRSVFPAEYHPKIRTIFDGVDTAIWRPMPNLPRVVNGFQIPDGVKVVTYATRGMESMRGFDVFMKAAKRICDRRKDVIFLIAGQDRVCYGGDERFTGGKTFKEWVFSQAEYDQSRFHFLGLIPPTELAKLFNRTDVHVYLTVPFVLSWSLLNALACGATVLASDTAPVREMIRNGVNGVLFDFFDDEALADLADQILDHGDECKVLGRRGAAIIREKYSVDVCLPRMVELYESVRRRREPATLPPLAAADAKAVRSITTQPSPPKPEPVMAKALLDFGEPAHWFHARTKVNPTYHFDTVGGFYIVLCFFGSAGNPAARRLLDAFHAARQTFEDYDAKFFGVSIDPADEEAKRVADEEPDFRYFWDFDRKVSEQYGAVTEAGYRPHTLLLDPQLRVIARIGANLEPEEQAAKILAALRAQPKFALPAAATVQAPILVVPRVFEPDLCRTLIQHYEDRGGEESGFMRDVDGKTVAMYDYSHKRRRDQEIEDEKLRTMCMHRIHDRLIPEIQKAYQFRATRMERYIVACYEAEKGGHFRRHRDNTTIGTAHRRFAISLILNTGEFEGGHLRFPEFGNQLYSAPAGGAVIFSCSLLHEATPVTKGRRYVFLPFLYDDAAAKIRQENAKFLGGEVNTPLEEKPAAAG
jgi:peroxiredoxin/predicted 2-oxoglutarate/Fe(II)-dependent dioxygenase YbiX